MLRDDFNSSVIPWAKTKRAIYYRNYGATIPYKWMTFKTTNCPRGEACANTVNLCGSCIDKSELGNLMYGATAMLVMEAEAFVVAVVMRLGKNGPDSLEDMAGVLGGLKLLYELFLKDYFSTDSLCDALGNTDVMWIANRVRCEFGADTLQHRLLKECGDPPLVSMREPLAGKCYDCPDPPPNLPHSTFGWVTGTIDLAKGWDPRKTYPDSEIDWDKIDWKAKL